MGCTNSRLEQARSEHQRTFSMPIEAASERSEMGDLYRDINKNPDIYFVKRDIKACFRKPVG